MIVHNAKVHIMNDNLDMAEAFAVLDGKIVEVGPERQIMNKYRADIVINAKLRDVFPGFHDAHGHIMSYARQKLNADLRNSRSYYEMISLLEKHQSKTQQEVIIGRGWDQSLWGEKILPNDSLLNVAFPNTPVALTRIDGHAMLINKAMRDFAGISDTTTISGGEFVKENGVLTGILLDNALNFINKKIPQPKEEDLVAAFMEVQDELLAAGITWVHEAGITELERNLLMKLAKNDELKINVYAMLLPSPGNLVFAYENGFYKKGKLSIRSFKIIADGALGSYGACLLHPYSDNPNTNGMLIRSLEEIQNLAVTIKKTGYQLNTHCIGDSANRIMLQMIDTLMQDEIEHRWRIEHAQVISPDDMDLVSKTDVLPSVQPTHATSDQRWAENRLGSERLNHGAYAYKTLQEQAGMILFGTDFPIESYDPFATIHAAVQRKNIEDKPIGGFIKDEAVSFDNTLKAMTVWAAYGCFEESNEGTIERGKSATFVVFDQPVESKANYLPNYSWVTVINGEIMFDMR